jgi:hypothetical protein
MILSICADAKKIDLKFRIEKRIDLDAEYFCCQLLFDVNYQQVPQTSYPKPKLKKEKEYLNLMESLYPIF